MGNLVLSRHEGERLLLETTEGQIVIKVVKVNSAVKLAVSAPASVRILREELLSNQRKCAESEKANESHSHNLRTR
jgi:carbon storage regulator CsrA